MAGLFAAHALTRAGFDVEVFERNRTELAGRGAGIVTHAALDRVLARLDLRQDVPLGPGISTRRVLDRSGQIVAERAFPQITTSWDRLFHVLRSAWPTARYHLGRAVRDIEAGIDPGSDAARVTFDDGSVVACDLVVGADGIRSRVRQAVAPHAREEYAGYVAWRGLVEERDLSTETRAVLGDCFAFCLPSGEQMLGYPVAGTGHDLTPGRRRYNFVWYRATDAEIELPRLLTDASGHMHAGSIPPPLIAPHILEETRAAAATRLAPAFAEVVARTPQLFFQPIVDLAVDRMVRGRAVLIGDAAFVARPHVGAGATKAAEDADVLASTLASTAVMSDALRAFETERRAVGDRIIARARQLGAYMQARRRTPEEHAAAERHRDPHAVLRETASLAFLDTPDNR